MLFGLYYDYFTYFESSELGSGVNLVYGAPPAERVNLVYGALSLLRVNLVYGALAAGRS